MLGEDQERGLGADQARGLGADRVRKLGADQVRGLERTGCKKRGVKNGTPVNGQRGPPAGLGVTALALLLGP